MFTRQKRENKLQKFHVLITMKDCEEYPGGKILKGIKEAYTEDIMEQLVWIELQIVNKDHLVLRIAIFKYRPDRIHRPMS